MASRELDSTRVVAVESDHLTINAGKIGLTQTLEQYPDTTAMICLTDRVAMGAMMECRRRNIRVPDDLAITGHGDFDFSEHLVPSLTTTHIDAFGIGERAGKILFKRIEEQSLRPSQSRVDVGFEVIPRDSSLSP